MTTGQRIQLVRKSAGLSQKQLGEKLGLSASMIGQWENDLRKPKYETLQRIANALGVNWTDLADLETKISISIEYLHRQAEAHPPPPIDRVRQVMLLMDPEGQEKVAAYAEDIYPSHRKKLPPSPEGKDTTPPPPPPESP